MSHPIAPAGALSLDGLHLAYGTRDILSELSVPALPPGTLAAVLGPNGSGKSTLLKAVAGLLRPTRGQVRLDGQDLAQVDFETRARQVVYLPQSLPAAVHLRVFESILVAAHASLATHAASGEELARIDALMARLGIGHLAMRFLDELSGGQKQLVGLAQALIRQPRLLLLDEPLSALDLNYQFHVMDLLRQETRERGLVTLIVLHDLNIALRHCDYTVMISGGHLAACGVPAEVITPQALADVYGVQGRVESCTRGHPQVIIDGLCEPVS